MDLVNRISLPLQDGFDQIVVQEAEEILYEVLIPQCEENGIMLSQYGNHAGKNSLKTIEEYNAEKEAHKLFNVETIQRIFTSLDSIVEEDGAEIGSYALKHRVEEHPAYGEHTWNGELIAAMILRGHTAAFEDSVNCTFNVRVRE